MTRQKVITMAKRLEQLESGDIARISGFYVSNHRHCNTADIWVRRDVQLPVCGRCGVSATFTLRKEIGHISEDPDFE